MPHSARKLPADLQAAMLKPDKPGPSIGKRRTKKAPKIPAWCPLPVTAWWDGRDSAAYQDALDRYCIETLEVSDPERRIMVYFDSATCSLCKNLPLCGGYTVCRHIGRIVDFDLANERGFMVSACPPARLPHQLWR